MISNHSCSLRLFTLLLAFTSTLTPSSTATLAASPPRVTVVTADGNQLQAELSKIDETGVHVDNGSDIITIPGDALSLVDFDAKPSQPLPTLVELVSGSRVHVSSLIWKDDQAILTPARQPAIEVPVSEIATVRFRNGNSKTDPVWLGWIQEPRRGDRLAVRRDEQALDSIDGTVVGVSRTAVEFEMGGNTIQAPLGKLEGFILAAAGSKSSSTAIRVVDVSGSSFSVTSVNLAPESDQLEISLPGSITHLISLDQVAAIEYSGGVLPLSEAEIASAEFGNGKSADPKRLTLWRSWFAPTPESSVTEGGTSTEPVIAMNTPGEISFRIPEGYQTLVAGVRRHHAVHQFLPVRVEVWVDGKQQWNAALKKRETLGLELPLAGARRLTLKAIASAPPSGKPGNEFNEFAFGTDQSLGGKLEWFGARLLK